jgi:NADH-quinone oxidoreductase subunit H
MTTMILVALGKAVFVVLFALTLGSFLTWVDRRGGAMFQDRLGPERAVWVLPAWLGQGAVLLVALLVAGGFIWWAQDPSATSRTTRALVSSHLAIFWIWASGLLIAQRIQARGVVNSFDNFIASLGDPRRIFYYGLGAHAVVVLAGLMLRGTPAGQILRDLALKSAPWMFALVVVEGATYSAYVLHKEGRVELRLWGLLHVAADGIKLAFKEDLVPPRADRLLHGIAPFIALFPVLVVLAVVPFGDTLCFQVDAQGATELSSLLPAVPAQGVCSAGAVRLQVVDLNMGLLFLFALSGTGVVGAALAGWSSDNKFSVLGGLRATSQMVSYEVTLGLTLIGAMMVTGALQPDRMVAWQADNAWGIFVQPVAFVLFFAAAVAETKRVPFDLPEGESELVAGYFTEYSGMKFAMFFFSEYVAVVVSAAVMATVFFGGWHVPFLQRDGLHLVIGDTVLLTESLSHGVVVLLGVVAFLIKVLALCWLQIAIRWTLPRFRYDQLMRLGWRMLLPASLLNLLATAIVVTAVQGAGPQTSALLRTLGDLSEAVVAVAGIGLGVVAVRWLLAPAEKRQLVASSTARFVASIGGVERARMGA